MRSRKLILALSAMVIVLTVAAFVLTQSTAKAQGMIEYAYAYCFQVPHDFEVPVPGEMVGDLEEFFEITWQDDYGLIITCSPRFQGQMKEFTKIEVCFTVYKDLDDNGWFSPFDTWQAEICETFKF